MPIDDRRIDREVLLPVALKHRAILKCDPDKWSDQEIQQIINDCGPNWKTMPVQNARLSCIALRKAGLLGKVDEPAQCNGNHSEANHKPQSLSFVDVAENVAENSNAIPKLSDMPLDQNWQRQCLITPECAAMAMSVNHGNRLLRKDAAKHVARMIEAGQWISDHPAPIVFSDAGRMIDGQHRIMGMILAGVPVIANCVGGARDEIREHIDTGMKRSLDDRVTFHSDLKVNQRCGKIVNSIFTISYYRRENGHVKHGNCKLTPSEAKELFDSRKEAISAIAEMATTSVKGIDRVPVMAAFVELYERNAELCHEFWNALHHANGDIQPARILRDWLLRYRGTSSGFGTIIELYTKSLCAMRAALEGREIALVRSGGFDL